MNSYKLTYDNGRIYIETSVYAENLKQAWVKAKQQLEYPYEPQYPREVGYIDKGSFDKKKATLKRTYKKDYK